MFNWFDKTGAFACTTQTASRLITASNGITIPSGKTLTANGGTESGAYNGPSGNNTDMTIGANQVLGNIAIGGAQNGTSTTGRLNIGVNNTSDIYLGSSNSATAGTNLGVCHINKCQFGNGSTFRDMRFGTLTTGTTITFSPTFLNIPIIFVSTPQSTNAAQIWTISTSAITTSGCTVTRQYFGVSGSTISGGGAFGEAVSWMAIG